MLAGSDVLNKWLFRDNNSFYPKYIYIIDKIDDSLYKAELENKDYFILSEKELFENYTVLEPVYVISYKTIDDIKLLVFNQYDSDKEREHLCLICNLNDRNSIYLPYRETDIDYSIKVGNSENFMYCYYNTNLNDILKNIDDIYISDILVYLANEFSIYIVDEEIIQSIDKLEDYLKTVTLKIPDMKTLFLVEYEFKYRLSDFRKAFNNYTLIVLVSEIKSYIIGFKELPIQYRTEEDTGFSKDELNKIFLKA